VAVRICAEDFDLGREVALLRAGNHAIGAIASFVGTVRDINSVAGDALAVQGMELEHYPGMTERALEEIIALARARWRVIDALIIHRIGALQPGDQIVLVAVASGHRGDAFLACEFIMDYLKTRAPFWKKEFTAGGARWVEGREEDEQAAARWQP
jgi:molybdopterin synthase catalytic subunit